MRNRLFIIGILPIIVALLFITKVGLMLNAQADGDSAYDEEKFAAAGEKFEGNTSLNFLESWIAPYNHGTALYRNADPEGAIKKFKTALADVPEKKECMVRVNIALSHEVIGDGVAETGREVAVESWQAGRDVLAEGDCPDNHENSRVVDERLKEKIEQKQDEQEPEEEPDEKDKEEQEKKKKELEERNQQGRAERKENQNYEDYRFTDRGDQYRW